MQQNRICWRSLLLAALSAASLLSCLRTAAATVSCYECDSSNNFSCTEFWDPNLPVTSQYYSNCSHVFEAGYCVKMTGVFDGKLGTKRFCSSKNWGNYCEYIKRPGGAYCILSQQQYYIQSLHG